MSNYSLCQNPLNQISNVSYVSYQFSVDPSLPNYTIEGNTNVVITDLVCVYTEKFANKSIVTVGDTVTYTIKIVNNSTVSVNNLFFYDTVPSGTSLIPNTFNVLDYGNVIGADPNMGIDLSTIVGELAPNSSCMLSFNVLFNYVPCPKQLINTAKVIYQYEG